MGHRNYAHVVEVAFWDYMIRILQTVLALALVILAAWLVVFANTWPDQLALFTVSCYYYNSLPRMSPCSSYFLGRLGPGNTGILQHCCPRTPLHLQLGGAHRHGKPNLGFLGRLL